MDCANYFLSKKHPEIPPAIIASVIKSALAEDIGREDITTGLCIPRQATIKAKIIAKENFLLCGLDFAGRVFKILDPSLKFVAKFREASRVAKGDLLAVVSGRASSILTAERVALNLLSFLSGVATKTSAFVEKIKPYKTKITDTRKTLIGLRPLQKYAVRIGGGYNHRMRLDEMVLIKDNHLKIMGAYLKPIKVPKGYKIEIEAQNLKEFMRALSFQPDVIMLDNMRIPDILQAVKIRDGFKFSRGCRTYLEASGGINLGNVKKYAASGVDLISIGELTDSISSVDISLEA